MNNPTDRWNLMLLALAGTPPPPPPALPGRVHLKLEDEQRSTRGDWLAAAWRAGQLVRRTSPEEPNPAPARRPDAVPSPADNQEN